MSKIIKFFAKPGEFFRDALLNKYPLIQNKLDIEDMEINKTINQLNKIENIDIGFEKFPVDVVYTWVNQTDVFNTNLQIYSEKCHSNAYSKNISRFENHDEILYSLKCVKKFMPWVNEIYVVTNSKKNLPEYLMDKSIHIIEHEEIIPSKFLPTFNSHVIEANLHKIPNLSEHFIYFNDDIIPARPLTRNHFFQANGICSLFVSRKTIIEKSNIDKTPTYYATMNCNKLIKKQYNKDIELKLIHTYLPLTKTGYKICYELFEKNINQFLNNKFRSNNDLNLASFLVPWVNYINQNSTIATDICYYFNIRSNAAISAYKSLLLGIRPHSICVNDVFCEHIENTYIDNLDKFLKSYLAEYHVI